MNEAFFYSRAENAAVKCELCPHNCLIPESKTGICGVRRNTGGKLYAASYGLVSSLALDPIEKKPLYRFHPGKKILSIGSFGCNLRCPFCQNSDISMEYQYLWPKTNPTAPAYIAALATKAIPQGNLGVAYTYNEPLVGYEFVFDCAKLVREAGLLNVLVTNGHLSRAPLEKMLPYIDAVNIDLKGFTDSFYKKLGCSLEAVKNTIEQCFRLCHVEITTLIIPEENDAEDEITALAQWIASLDPLIPLHLSRFFPRYRYAHKTATSRETIYRLSAIARNHLTHVYTGNMG